MQLFGDGKLQGKGVTAIPFAGRPSTPAFDGTWVGDTGFDPLTISGFLPMRSVSWHTGQLHRARSAGIACSMAGARHERITWHTRNPRVELVCNVVSAGREGEARD